ncbi:histone-lysine N-methyltransferase ATX2-like isoform X2 [Apium graveolens]|uniref:histone-lysine N-methyltransferase ATX2-like isoform X2 n=1 Tax=Apium graveolens TaxID=4045 RepID=UPI003D7B796B
MASDDAKTRVKYVAVTDLYSSTTPCVTAAGSKKVKARKLPDEITDDRKKPPVTRIYSRRNEKNEENVFENLNHKDDSVENDVVESKVKRRRVGNSELSRLGVDSSVLKSLCSDGEERSSRRRSCNGGSSNCGNSGKLLAKGENSSGKVASLVDKKKWTWLSYKSDPTSFIGLQCKVYWPLDDDWYTGSVVGYNAESEKHHVEYKDGDEEDIILSNERIKFFVSPEEMRHLNLSHGISNLNSDKLDINEMVVLAASLDNCHELDPGEIIWAKLSGHANWPAIVLDESVIGGRKGLNKITDEKSILVQFFGTHDFARVRMEQAIPFLKGLLSSCHLKCKKSGFLRSLDEAKMYLSTQKLPKRMLRLRKSNNTDNGCTNGEEEGSTDSDDEGTRDTELKRTMERIQNCPFEIEDLQVQSFGNIVSVSDCFFEDTYICPDGYTAVRKFPSILDPSVHVSYKMEVLRDPATIGLPLFRVTSENGEKFEGSTSSFCWDKIFRRIRKMHSRGNNALKVAGVSKSIIRSGPAMFGFSHPEILKIMQVVSSSKLPSKIFQVPNKRDHDVPAGFRPVHVNWNDLDRCNVCHMDEEYENNPFLQCDKCRMMVHARCYGELEPVDGILWYCNLCREGTPESPPPCCLCPIIGGAMKQTVDGRWAHLACAIWIPETCLSDVKKMEPIDGLSRINKDRWKLLCSICGVSYGACIQCSNSSCYVAYHPLCARAAGFCVEPEDEDRLHIIPLDEDEDNQWIRLLSFCKRHRPSSQDHSFAGGGINRSACQHTDYTPPVNSSGCARSEPYNSFGRRGRKEPEALAAVSLKRLYVENRPYLVRGYSQHESLSNVKCSRTVDNSKIFLELQKLKTGDSDATNSIVCMAEKYSHMRNTFRKRLAFGKSGIHGFGIFAKQPHRAGDMVIEYTGEIVRAPVADRREHCIYNSIVGAGTYMFRIDDECVIDATSAGSIAHLINHSCEPNCYSRGITVNGNQHVIIFAKRDIKQWEELTYDYRFLSIDEQLACYCGFPRCRGVVNDIDAEEQKAKLYVPRSQLKESNETERKNEIDGVLSEKGEK